MAIQSVESNLIEPLVMSRAISLHPVVIVFALLTAGTPFGFAGLLLAVPFLASLHVLVEELWTKKMDAEGTDPGAPYQEEKRAEEPSLSRGMDRSRRALAARLHRP